jgi:DNA-directed RNA polymerase specialized sigma24 family protein
MRFIEVNKEFYDQIFAEFPNLSQGDQKLCALIKLNFSSKEMSRLLGISVESVHTLRHRIRKKMKLSRSINLEDFINSI